MINNELKGLNCMLLLVLVVAGLLLNGKTIETDGIQMIWGLFYVCQ